MTTNEIRQKYLDFFSKKEHSLIPRANLVPQEDATTLFTGSGMQPLVPYLLGSDHPGGKRLVDSQTCFRAEDIDEIGDNRHTTFFEMLGNWSLGDYFKQDQLAWFFEFITKKIGLKPENLYVTVFAGDVKSGVPRDDESANLWQKLFQDSGVEAKVVELLNNRQAAEVGMQGGRIFYYDQHKNWWSRTGDIESMPVGEPGGPDSEVFYDFGTEHNPEYGENCHPNCDCGRFLEIGNSVFMQYVKNKNGSFDELPRKNVDFGGGLERIAAAKNQDSDIYKIDLLWPIIRKIEETSSKNYQDNQDAMRVIADHLRAAVWLGVDGVTPSNTQQGYVMRRLLRRAIRQCLNLDLEHDVISRLAPEVFKIYKISYPETTKLEAEVVTVLTKEETTFRQTLRRGLREFNKVVGNELNGEAIFSLFDTYGFPPELSIEEATKQGKKVQTEWKKQFEQKMQEQKERSRTATKGQFKGGLGGHGDAHKKYHTATHLMYRALREVLGDHVVQRGSNITEERLRFDFSHPDKMTDEQKAEVERIVNDRIQKDLEVTWQELPTQEALGKGAYGAFGDKYGDTVKVYSMKDNEGKTYSFEICGGPHVEHTGELAEDGKKFKIAKEQSSSAGIRRIKAVLQ